MEEAVQAFLEANRSQRSFVMDSAERQQLWNNAEQLLKSPSSSDSSKRLALECVCVLSRDKEQLVEGISDDLCRLIVQESLLSTPGSQCCPVSLEALKCLGNLSFQLESFRKAMCGMQVCRLVVDHIETILQRDPSQSPLERWEQERMMVRLYFILSAHELNVIKDGAPHALDVLATFLGLLKYREDLVDVICDTFKAIYNLLTLLSSHEASEAYSKLVSIIDLHLSPSSVSVDEAVVCQCVNALTALNDGKELSVFSVDSAVALLDVLRQRLDDVDQRTGHGLSEITKMREKLCPILNAMRNIVRANKATRKVIRLAVLPPLEIPEERPEVGATLRSGLVRLLTSPVNEVKEIAGEFLFLLCKCKVGRLVKYVGYGNAAGFLATRGLLAPQGEAPSSSSEESETEEWREVAEEVNPVTGVLEPPYENPMAHMTEEQKEVEAVRLANVLAGLDKTGLIRPARIGPDGKPYPVEHVLELLEGFSDDREEHSD